MMMDPEDMRAAATLGGISALAATCRIILSQDERDRTFIGWASLFIVGIFSGMVAWYSMHGLGWDENLKVAICLVSALSARELLLAVIKVGEVVRDQSGSVAKTLIDRRINRD